MMRLTTQSLGPVKNGYGVSWAVGLERRGIIIVEGLDIEDPKAAAEIVSIKHLLFGKNVLNRDIYSGSGIALYVSSPVIRKLARKKSTKKHLMELSSFFLSNLKGIEINNTTDNNVCLPSLSDNVEHEQLPMTKRVRADIIETPILGKIRMSAHAVEQFEKRMYGGVSNKPMRSLVRRLNNEKLIRRTLSDRVMKHKTMKYKDATNLELWSHDTSEMNYLIVRDPATSIGTLVTVFRRHRDYFE